MSIVASRQVIVYAKPDDGDWTTDTGDEPVTPGTDQNRKGRPKGSKNKSLFNSFNHRCEKRSFVYSMRPGPAARCTPCGRTYDGDPLAHSLEHHQTVCPVCGRSFKSSLAEHIKSHGTRHQVNIMMVTCYECYDCREKFGNAQTMAEHVLDEHVVCDDGDGDDGGGGGRRGKRCALCDSTDFVNSEDGLRDHVSAVHTVDVSDFPHLCTYCDEPQHDRTGLVEHLIEKHSWKTAAVVVNGLSCVSCDLRFGDRAAIADHLVDVHCPMKTFSHPAVYRCRVCKAGFKTQINVLRHACNGIKVPHCERCDKTFPSKMRYAFHLQFHEHPLYARMHLHCDLCLAEFTNEYHLYDHIRFRHELHDKAVCEICGRTFKSSMGLNIHRRYHDGLRNFTCKLCDKSFLNKSTLKEHEISHMDVKPFQCHICGQYLSRASRLRSHVKTHRAAESTEQTCYCCGACGFVAPGPGLLTDHVNKEHGDRDRSDDVVVQLTSVVKCEFCDSTYADAMRLDEHRDAAHVNTADDSEAFVCMVCSSAFSTYSRLTTHKLTHGINVESVMADIGRESDSKDDDCSRFHIPQYFSCQHCAKMCLHYTYFCLHRRLKHAPGVKTHTCDLCYMDFKTSWKLTYHKKTVHGQLAAVKSDNKYQCTVCSRKFIKLGALNLHKTRTHIDVVSDMCKYLCHRCGKFFSSEECLKTHDRDDASCEYRCNDPAAVRRHQRRTYRMSSAATINHPPAPLSPVPNDAQPCSSSSSKGVRKGNNVVSPNDPAPLHPSSPVDVECVLCHERYFDSALFRQHMREHVTSYGAYLCELCLVPFLSSSTFDIHTTTQCPTAHILPTQPDVLFVDVPKEEPLDEPKPLVVDCSAIFKMTPLGQNSENTSTGINERKALENSTNNELFSDVSTSRTSAMLDEMDSLRMTKNEKFNELAGTLEKTLNF